MTAARPTIREKREHKIDQARELFKEKNMSTTELAKAMDASWTSAHAFICELLATGEIRRFQSKNKHNGMTAVAFAWAGADGVATPVVEEPKPRPARRFNPAQWCVQDDAGSAS